MKLFGKAEITFNGFLLKHIFPLLLFFIWLLIFFTNYVPGTILSGWDTLHPEFNFSLNFERLFFGSWREEQGLGAVAAHAHIADLPRVILIWLSSIILPIEFLRFAFISICLLIGAIGTFYFIRNIFFDHLKRNFAELFAFSGALFYLCNLGTIQHFYVPFEMFTVQYAFLPWIFLSVCNYIHAPSKRRLILVGIANLLAAPMAYAPLLWYVYFTSLLLFLSIYFFKKRKAVIQIILVTLLVNLFWLLPNIYFLLSGNAALVPEAKINKLFSEEAYLQNASFGNILDVLLFKNFLFNWPVYVGFDRFDYLLTFWRNHIANPFILLIGYLAAALSFYGIIGSTFHKKKQAIGLLLPLLLAFFFLLGSTFPLSFITDFLRDHNSLFKEALRFPFTKFSIIAMFVMAVFFSLGNYYLFNLISKLKLIKQEKIITTGIIHAVVVSILLIIFCLPIFQGQLISRLMQVKIPEQYNQLFNYLNSSDGDGRVVVFPIHSFWGWTYYNWGFQGAQFITFGIRQPVLDRDWDRWNPKNEEFYRQLSYAAYSDNEQLFESVLKKYNVEFLVIDDTVIAAGSESDKRSLNLDQTKLLLARIPKLAKVQELKDLTVYRYEQQKGDIKLTTKLPELDKQTFSEDVDYDYLQTGNYIANTKGLKNLSSDNLNFLDPNLIKVNNTGTKLTVFNSNKLFSELLNAELFIPVNVYAEKNSTGVSVSLTPIYLPNSADNGFKLNFSNIQTENALLNFDSYQTIELNNLNTFYQYYGIAYINTKQFNNISIYENTENNAVRLISDQSLRQPQLNADTNEGILDFPINLCNKPAENQIFGATDIENGTLTISAKNSKACVWIPLEKIVDTTEATQYKTLTGFKFTIDSESNSLGRFCLFDMGRQRCVLEKKYVLSGDEHAIYFTTDPGLLSHLEVVLYLDGTEKDKLEQITYTDLSVQTFLPNETISIPPTEINDFFSQTEITRNNELTITPADNSYFTVDIYEPGHSDNECDSLQALKADRIKTHTEITYTSQNGSSCDYFSMPNVSHASGYMVEIENKNNSGLPMRVCIANPYSKRCDIYTTLKQNKDFAKDYLLIPPIFDGGVGYDIHFDNFAVGNFESSNSLRSLKLIPVPYHFLRASQQTTTPTNAIETKQSEKIFPGVYQLNLENNTENTTLMFDQSYEKGWWSNFGKHVLVNGWQNGWIREDTRATENVYIIFWPEFLELIGLFFLLLFSAISLPIFIKKRGKMQ